MKTKTLAKLSLYLGMLSSSMARAASLAVCFIVSAVNSIVIFAPSFSVPRIILENGVGIYCKRLIIGI